MSKRTAKRRQQEPEADPLDAFSSESGSPELRAFPSEAEPPAPAGPYSPSSNLWMVLLRVAGAAAIGIALGLLYPTFLPSPPEPEPAPAASSATATAPPTSPPVTAAPDTSQPLAPAKPAVAPPTAAARPNDAAAANTAVPPPAPSASTDAARAPASIVAPTESASPLVLGVIRRQLPSRSSPNRPGRRHRPSKPSRPA